MRGTRRVLTAALLAAGMLGAVGAAPATAAAAETGTSAAAALAPGTYGVYDSSGKLVGWLVIGADGSAKLYPVLETRQV